MKLDKKTLKALISESIKESRRRGGTGGPTTAHRAFLKQQEDERVQKVLRALNVSNSEGMSEDEKKQALSILEAAIRKITGAPDSYGSLPYDKDPWSK